MAGMNLRDKLGKYYDLDTCIPQDIQKQIVEEIELKQGSTSPLRADRSIVDERTIQKLLGSKVLSIKDKEALSSALLKGKFDDENVLRAIQKYESHSNSPPKLAKQKPLQAAMNTLHKKVTELRYDLNNRVFLELKSKNMEIHPLQRASPINRSTPALSSSLMGSSVLSTHDSVSSLFSPPQRKELYFWGNQTIERQDRPTVPRSTLDKESTLNAAIALKNKSASEFKRTAVVRQREEINELKQEAEKIRNAEREAKDKLQQTRRTAREFRKMIINRLKEKHDPQLGDIARCIDEQTIIEFLEKYRGYSMSLDGLMNLLSTPLGKSQPIFDAHSALSAVGGHDEIQIPDSRLAPPLIPTSTFTGRDLSPASLRKYGSGFQFTSREGNRTPHSANKLKSLGLTSSEDMGSLDSTAKAIEAVRTQMKLESTLPSLQPLRILTDEQLTTIGHDRRELNKLLDRLVPPPGVVTFKKLPVPAPSEFGIDILADDFEIGGAADGAADWKDVMDELSDDRGNRRTKQDPRTGVVLVEADNDDDDDDDDTVTVAEGSIQNEIIEDVVSNLSHQSDLSDEEFEPFRRKGLLAKKSSGSLPIAAKTTTVKFDTVNPVRAPKSIKTHLDDAAELNVQEGSMEFMQRLAKSPYTKNPGTIPEATIVMSSGLAAGAGLSLWGPKRKDLKGRWIPGKRSNQRPFVSAT